MNSREAEAKEFLEGMYGSLTKLGFYHRMDFHEPNGDLYIEFKGRTNAREKYATTMVGATKVRWLQDYQKGLFVFGFTDGFFSIRYDEALFKTFEVRKGGRCDRGIPELSQYYYIPVELLDPISCTRHSLQAPDL